MARLLLVQTPHLQPDPSVNQTLDSWYGLGLASLHAVAEQAGHTVWPLNANGLTRPQFMAALVEAIERFVPTVVGLQVLTSMRGHAFHAVRHLRAHYPNVRIVLGGPHASAMAGQIVECFPHVVVVQGEGEVQLPPLLAAFDSGAPLRTIPGIVFRQGNETVRTLPPPLIDDLDSLPWPRHDAWAGENAACAGLMTSRGCPFTCSFCAVAGRPMRLRRVGAVVDEIDMMLSRMPGLRHIRIWDDQFFFKPRRVIELCNEIVRRNIQLGFTCLGRIRPCTREMVLAMEAAGFREVLFGLETGSPRIAERCDKKIRPADALDTLALFADSPIDVHCFLIVGLEGETWETVSETAAFVQRLQAIKYAPGGATTAIATVYPDNALYPQCLAVGIIGEQFWLDAEHDPYFTLEHPAETLMDMRDFLLDHIEPSRMLVSPLALEKQKALIPKFLAYVVRHARGKETPHCSRHYLSPFVELLRNVLAELDAEGELRIELPQDIVARQHEGLGLFPVLERCPGRENVFRPVLRMAQGTDLLIDFLDYAYRHGLTEITRRVDAAFVRQVARLHESGPDGTPQTPLSKSLLAADSALRQGDFPGASVSFGEALATGNDIATRLGQVAALILAGDPAAAAAALKQRSPGHDEDVRVRFAEGVIRGISSPAIPAGGSEGGPSVMFAGRVDVLPRRLGGGWRHWSAFRPAPGQSDAYVLLPKAMNWSFLQVAAGQPGTAARAEAVVVNLLADPDLCANELRALQAWLAQSHSVCLNPPAAVLQTSRDRVARTLTAIPALRVPRTLRWTPGATALPPSLSVRGAGLTLPLLIRPVGSHTGAALQIITSHAELDALLSSGSAPAHYLTEYVDCRHADGLYRKTRAFLIGKECILAHHLVSPVWNVHLASADTYMDRNADVIDEEARVLGDPEGWLGQSGRDGLVAIRKQLGLDYLIVDFSKTEDGNLVLFEANPVCRFSGAERPSRVEPLYQAEQAFSRLLDASRLPKP